MNLFKKLTSEQVKSANTKRISLLEKDEKWIGQPYAAVLHLKVGTTPFDNFGVFKIIDDNNTIIATANVSAASTVDKTSPFVFVSNESENSPNRNFYLTSDANADNGNGTIEVYLFFEAARLGGKPGTRPPFPPNEE